MLNKLAQLRYRDRARLKVEVLQGEVGGMEAQLTTLRLAQDANDVLAEKNRCIHRQHLSPGCRREYLGPAFHNGQ